MRNWKTWFLRRCLLVKPRERINHGLAKSHLYPLSVRFHPPFVFCQKSGWLLLVTLPFLQSCLTWATSLWIFWRNVSNCDMSRRCSCILNSTWNSAIQQTTDSRKQEVEHKPMSVFLPFVCVFSVGDFMLNVSLQAHNFPITEWRFFWNAFNTSVKPWRDSGSLTFADCNLTRELNPFICVSAKGNKSDLALR